MRTGTRGALLALAAALVAPAPAAAQTGGAAPEAEAAARRLFADLDGMRWTDAAARFHPLAVERFRAAQLRQVHQLMAMDANPRRFYGRDVPPAVSAWMQQRDSAARARFGPEYLHDFTGVRSVAELDSLPAFELLAHWLEAHDERVRFRRELDRLRPEVSPQLGTDTFQHHVNTVLGSVLENDTTAHVLVRTGLAGDGGSGRFGDVSVLTLRRAGGEWRAWRADEQAGTWVGVGFGIAVDAEDSPEDRARMLDAVKDSTLPWRDTASGTRVRAAVVGYPGGGRHPRGVIVEVRAADGSLRSAEIPFGAVQGLISYMMPWAVAAEAEAFATPH